MSNLACLAASLDALLDALLACIGVGSFVLKVLCVHAQVEWVQMLISEELK